MTRCWVIISLFMLIAAAQVYGQEQKSIMRLAEEAYARQEYAVAGALYGRLARGRGNRLPVAQWLKLARSYQEIGHFKEAADYYRQVLDREEYPAGVHFAYGEVLRQLEQYEEAHRQYELFHTTDNDSLQLKTTALQGCDSAILWSRHPLSSVRITPLKELNTPGSDVVSGVVRKGLLLISNGYRSLGLNGGAESYPAMDKRTEQPYYKSYVYRQYSQGNATMYLEELLPSLLGSYNYHIGPVCLSHNEDTMYVTINMQGRDIPGNRKGPMNGTRRLQLCQSIKKDGEWAPLVPLPGLNMPNYSSGHAVLNSSGDVLYFVSDRPGGYGQTDIWYCEKQADGSWGTPLNCGDNVNTPAEETFPTVNEAGILYFSSKGHVGMGGYDIYRVKGSKNTWDMPENMKVPFNSGADELGLVLKSNGYEGYLASSKPGGLGRDDIYHFTDPDYFRRLGYGDHSAGKDHAGPVTVPGKSTAQPPRVTRALTPEEEEDKRVLEQLKFYYNYNSIALSVEARSMLNQVADILKRRPDWKLVIKSYTDSRGSDQYNIDLSAMRCYAVIDYLVNKGIDARRLYYSNQGEQHPVNRCKDGVSCSEEEYKKNRRSSLEVRR